jgi:hypothetical protein
MEVMALAQDRIQRWTMVLVELNLQYVLPDMDAEILS